MAKKKERKKTYKFIEKLIDKVTTSKSNNTEFVCYGHLVELLSGTEDYVSVTIYNTDDRYGGEMADFSFDYLTKELHFVSSEGKALTEKIIATFRMFYSRRIRVSYDEVDYEDEDTTYEYDETDEYACQAPKQMTDLLTVKSRTYILTDSIMTTNLLKSNSQGVPSAAFTGHRHIPYVKYPQIKGRLKVAIYNAYLQGVRNFKCGMAVGFDMLAAEAVLELKGLLHDISLSAIVPYRNQSERFAPSARKKYDTILEKADDVTVLSEDYYTRCFLERNDYMIQHSSLLIAYFDGKPQGGTFYTCNKAAAKGMPVNNLYSHDITCG